jgi:predicted RNase H-like HicB family nuclease
MPVNEIEFSVTIVVEPDGNEYHAYCPALKGLHTSGSTREEACQHAADAAMAYLQSLIKHHEPLPIGLVQPLRVIAPAQMCQRTGTLQVAAA